MNTQLRKAIEQADAGDWDAAHRIVQQIDDTVACWLHANLHREEGDLGNADYWYKRAAKSRPDTPFSDERATIREAMAD